VSFVIRRVLRDQKAGHKAHKRAHEVHKETMKRQKLGNKLIEANLTAFEWPKIIIS